jgi:hypothetical protein
VASREVAEIESGIAEGCSGNHLPLRNEAIGDSPLIEHLNRAYVQPTGAQAVYVLALARLHNRDVDSRQRQFACQH